jgi:hypothetical protein
MLILLGYDQHRPEWGLPFREAVQFCYLSVILKADSKVVISFFKRANPLSRFALFILMIYVNRLELIQVKIPLCGEGGMINQVKSVW